MKPPSVFLSVTTDAFAAAALAAAAWDAAAKGNIAAAKEEVIHAVAKHSSGTATAAEKEAKKIN